MYYNQKTKRTKIRNSRNKTIRLNTVEPLVSDHPECKMQRLSGRLITGGGRLQESNHREPLPRRGSGTSASWKMIYCMQCLS